MGAWYKDWFSSEEYLIAYSHRNESDAAKLNSLILSETKLVEGSKILDAACGAGRHSILFARQGYKVSGFDLSEPLLSIAKRKSEEENLKIDYRMGDFRTVEYNEQFDLVINLFTSFGYFDDDDENFCFLGKAYSYLNTGGFYVLDFFNSEYLMEHLQEKSLREQGDYSICEEREIVGKRVVKRISISKNDQTNQYTESVRLYTVDELKNAFVKSGYTLHKMFGDYNGEDFSRISSPRAIMIFKK